MKTFLDSVGVLKQYLNLANIFFSFLKYCTDCQTQKLFTMLLLLYLRTYGEKNKWFFSRPLSMPPFLNSQLIGSGLGSN